MDYPTIIADKYNQIILLSEFERENLDFIDKVIYEIVSIRCEIEISSYESLFEQYFLNENHLDTFILMLSEVDDEYLTNVFKKVKLILSQNNFWQQMSFDNTNEDFRNQLDIIFNELDENQMLWKIDEKLGLILVNNK